MTEVSKAIVCIGWGSLIWDKRELPIDGVWHPDGPKLPLEFARQSTDGRLTLVIIPSEHLFTTYWATLRAANIDDAMEALRMREATNLGNIAQWPSKVTSEVSERVGQWAVGKGIAGVIWTNLLPKFNHQNGKIPTSEEAVTYLSQLSGEKRDRAEKYVRMAPKQIQTPYRSIFESELGWFSEGLE